MKKELALLFFLFIIPTIISAVEIKLSQNYFQPSETLQAQITGNFVSLSVDNINIYAQDKVHSEPIIKDLIKYSNVYYVYAIMPKIEGNYTFTIENTLYTEKGEWINDPIKIDVPIYYQNDSALTINPGFIIANNNSISFTVKSVTSSQTINATFLATGESLNKFLPENVQETMTFTLPPLPPGQSTILVNHYQIPVFLIKKTTLSQELQLEFIPFEIKDTLTKNYFLQVALKNTGTKNATDITLFTTMPAKITPDSISLLQPNTIKIINISFSFYETKNKTVEGVVQATTLNQTFDLPIFFTQSAKNNLTQNNSQNPLTSIFSCSQLGTRCTEANTQCTGDTVESLEGPCCIGDCVPIETSNTKNIVGIILIILLILIVLFIIYKVIRKRREKNVDDILEEKTEKIKKRIKGEEVSGKLDRA
ncbi:MAG: hypothetical protein AABX16_04625 [Nanoarchaeota archaeon]